MVVWALQNAAVSGAMNVTAPAPVTNREFAATLGRVMHRPWFLPAPAFALRLALGEMADALLLSGQRAMPTVAQSGGFQFEFPTLQPALASILDRGSRGG
jgi:NAD dependent epimerase/dehydratase family enzyme